MAEQFLRSTTAQPGIVFSAGDADASVTYTVTSETGTVLQTGTATNQPDNGLYTFLLAPQAQLNRLTIAWTGAWGLVSQTIRTYAEITGGRLFTVGEARAYRDRQLADAAEYPDNDIREAHDRIVEDFQNACGVPFFPRYEHELITVNRYSSTTLWLPWKRPLRLISVSVSGLPLTGPELSSVVLEPTGRMTRAGGWGTTTMPQTVEVEWERGYAMTPEPIKRAGLALAHYELISSEITDRMVSFANELGTVRLSTPGRNTPTGIPLVDATLMRYDERDSPMVAIR